MKKVFVLMLALLFIATLTFAAGCKKAEEQKSEETPATTPAMEEGTAEEGPATEQGAEQTTPEGKEPVQEPAQK
jgi:hypothetical protein